MTEERIICVKKILGKFLAIIKSIDAFWWLLLALFLIIKISNFIHYKDCLRNNSEWICNDVKDID